MEPIRKIAVNYGIVLGILLILAGAIVYAVDLNLFTNFMYGIFIFLLVAAFGVIAAVKAKTAIGGFMTFKQAFTAFFITILIGLVFNTVFSIVLFNFVDPEAKEIITENIIKSTVEMMEKFGAGSADINKTVDEMQKKDSFGFAGQLQGFVTSLIFYCIVGLIAALVIRRNPPESL